jgi:hypothetical protein
MFQPLQQVRTLILDNHAISDWPLICYLQRFQSIAVRHGEDVSWRHLLAQSDINEPEWNLIPLPLHTYRLYIRL